MTYKTLATSALVFVLAISLFAQTNETTATTNPIVAYVYVGTDFQTNPGKIFGFSVRKDGSLGVLSGSPVTGPAQQLVVSPGFVRGSDLENITSYTRESNGALHATATINGLAGGNPMNSGVGAITLDRSASTLYVGEINFDGPDNAAYAEFATSHSANLKLLTTTPVHVDFDGPLFFSPDNQFAYGRGCFFVDWDIFAFHRLADGALKAFDPGNTFPPDPTNDVLCPNNLATSAKGFLAVAYGVASEGAKQKIVLERITSTGGLEVITNSVISTNFTGVTMHFDPTGNFLAVAGNSGIEAFRLNANGTLTKIGGVVEPGVSFADVHWDDAGHAFAISNSALYVFTLNSTGLTVAGRPHTLAHAGSLAVLSVH